MFAFTLADEKTGELFLAHDPLGIKPLFSLRRGGHRGIGQAVLAQRDRQVRDDLPRIPRRMPSLARQRSLTSRC
jgi:hypothetical protein